MEAKTLTVEKKWQISLLLLAQIFWAWTKDKTMQWAVSVHGMREPSKCKEHYKQKKMSQIFCKPCKTNHNAMGHEILWKKWRPPKYHVLGFEETFSDLLQSLQYAAQCNGAWNFMERATLQIFLFPPVTQFHNLHSLGLSNISGDICGVNFSESTIIEKL